MNRKSALSLLLHRAVGGGRGVTDGWVQRSQCAAGGTATRCDKRRRVDGGVGAHRQGAQANQIQTNRPTNKSTTNKRQTNQPTNKPLQRIFI
eukprot:119042-Pyramimonas_sp.AAC.1